ncbi:MAG TPA: hypothetical protein VLA71_18920 [Algoriphagus sp.]|nr:hypothetical protein [Algoriphagus sp.]
MNTKAFFYPILMLLFLAACSEKDTTKESIEAQNEMSGEHHAKDTNMVKRDGTLLEGAMDKIDSIPLPMSVISTIEKDASISTGAIVTTRKFTEGNTTYYEVKFSTENNQTKTVVYDENGKVKADS